MSSTAKNVVMRTCVNARVVSQVVPCTPYIGIPKPRSNTNTKAVNYSINICQMKCLQYFEYNCQ